MKWFNKFILFQFMFILIQVMEKYLYGFRFS